MSRQQQPCPRHCGAQQYGWPRGARDRRHWTATSFAASGSPVTSPHLPDLQDPGPASGTPTCLASVLTILIDLLFFVTYAHPSGHHFCYQVTGPGIRLHGPKRAADPRACLRATLTCCVRVCMFVSMISYAGHTLLHPTTQWPSFFLKNRLACHPMCPSFSPSLPSFLFPPFPCLLCTPVSFPSFSTGPDSPHPCTPSVICLVLSCRSRMSSLQVEEARLGVN